MDGWAAEPQPSYHLHSISAPQTVILVPWVSIKTGPTIKVGFRHVSLNRFCPSESMEFMHCTSYSPVLPFKFLTKSQAAFSASVLLLL